MAICWCLPLSMHFGDQHFQDLEPRYGRNMWRKRSLIIRSNDEFMFNCWRWLEQKLVTGYFSQVTQKVAATALFRIAMNCCPHT